MLLTLVDELDNSHKGRGHEWGIELLMEHTETEDTPNNLNTVTF